MKTTNLIKHNWQSLSTPFSRVAMPIIACEFYQGIGGSEV